MTLIQVAISELEQQHGLVILPKEQVVAMLERPTNTKIHFTQFLASLSGTITCIGKSCIVLTVYSCLTASMYYYKVYFILMFWTLFRKLS